jgi:hypothetical protein
MAFETGAVQHVLMLADLLRGNHASNGQRGPRALADWLGMTGESGRFADGVR